MIEKHAQVLIIGGGTAGIMVAAQLKRKQKDLSVTIIDPADTHYYQPAFTLVGGGAFNMQDTKRKQADLIPAGVTWIQDSVTAVDPEHNSVATAKSGNLTYDYLVVAPGLVYDFSLIEGLEEALAKGAVCSNYIDPEYTWKQLQAFKGGNAIFTQPTTPIKCGGAPQKAMYLAADHFRKTGIADTTNVVFATPGTVIFGVKNIAATLMEVIARYNIDLRLFHAPVKIDADRKLVYFKNIAPADKEQSASAIKGSRITEDGLIEVPFDFLHLAPPQVAPAFLRQSSLVNGDGWVNVDSHSMQHRTYSNVFSLGDAAGLPTSKTGAAIRKQAPVVVDNLLKLVAGKAADNSSYDGYTSCPLVTGYGKMVLAEFDYKSQFTPDPMLKLMLITDSDKEHWRLWMLKKYMLPYMYWNKMLKGSM